MRQDPRLQNVPVRTEVGRRVREAFTGRGPFIACDYSQIELRVLATLKAEEMDKESAFEDADREEVMTEQCSFCKATDSRRLVCASGTAGVFICCECVVLAQNIFEEEELDRRAPVPWAAGWWSMPTFDAFGNLLSPANYFNDVLQALGE